MYAAQYDLINVPVEKESSLLPDNLLDKGVYSLQNLLTKLQSFTETFDSNGCKFCYLQGGKKGTV